MTTWTTQAMNNVQHFCHHESSIYLTTPLPHDPSSQCISIYTWLYPSISFTFPHLLFITSICEVQPCYHRAIVTFFPFQALVKYTFLSLIFAGLPSVLHAHACVCYEIIFIFLLVITYGKWIRCYGAVHYRTPGIFQVSPASGVWRTKMILQFLLVWKKLHWW